MAAILLRAPAPVAVPAAAAAGGRGPGRLRFSSRPAVFAGAAAAALALVVAGGSLSRQGLADYFQQRAENALADDPLQAIREANRALRLDSENPATYYVKAAALARFNEAEPARRTLRQAVAKEPDNFVTWALIGDLEVRRGRFVPAQLAYEEASRLNPGDHDLRELAGNPHLPVSSGGTP